MKYFLILLAALISACGTVPVHRNFPDIPPALHTPCDSLTIVPDTTQKLSEVLSVVVSNYGKYHECTSKVESWQQWYAEQRKIFDTIK